MRVRPVFLCCLLWLGAGAQQPARPPASAENLRIQGTVVDALNGKALAHARVGITPVSGENTRTVTTGEDGRFLFQGLARGKYVLAAEKAGYPPQSFEGHEGYYTSIAVGPGLKPEGLVFRMQPESSISGTITNERDEPVKGAQLLLSRAVPFFLKADVQSETTDQRGYYSFDHLQPGTYRLAVSGEPWFAQCERTISIAGLRREPAIHMIEMGVRGQATQEEGTPEEGTPDEAAALKRAFPLTFYPQTTDEAAAAPIVLSAGKQLVADMRLDDVPALRLRVLGHAGDAEVDAEIEQMVFSTPNPAIASSAERESRQAVRFACLAPGHYDLNVSVAYAGKTRTLHRAIDLSADTDIDVTQAPAAVPVSGAIRLSPSAPLPPGLRVCIKGSESEGRHCSTVSESGEFNFGTGVPTGSYEIQIKPSYLLMHRAAANGAKIKPDDGELEIDGDHAVRLSLVVGRGSVTLDGMVANDGVPVAGALVLLVPAEAEGDATLYVQEYALDQSDGDGTFTLFNVFPGHYVLLAIEHGWDVDWSTPAAVKPYLEHGQAITVQGAINDLKVKSQPKQP